MREMAVFNDLVYNLLDDQLQVIILASFLFLDETIFEENTITVCIPNESEIKGFDGHSCTHENVKVLYFILLIENYV